MRDDHAHVMQVKLCKANTRGVTAPPPNKNLVLRFARPTILGKRWDKLLVDNPLSLPRSILFTVIVPHHLIELNNLTPCYSFHLF